MIDIADHDDSYYGSYGRRTFWENFRAEADEVKDRYCGKYVECGLREPAICKFSRMLYGKRRCTDFNCGYRKMD
jgi:hypothetical protein